MADYDYLPVSNGSGDAPIMHVSGTRVVGSTTLTVDTVTNVPAKFVATSGTLQSNGLIDPTTKTDFKGHLSGSDIIIDGYEPGSSDIGHSVGQVVIIKPNTGWANRIASFIKNATGFGTPEALYAASLNLNGTDIAALLMPTGAVLPYAGGSAPTGFLLCQGQAISRSTYAALFTALGTAYGTGDGSTTFNIPDLRGRVAVGKNSATFATLGAAGGEETHTLTTGEMPVHNHGVTDPGHQHTVNAKSSNVQLNPGTSTYGVFGTASDLIAQGAGTGISIQNAGNGNAHNNLQPYLVMNHIIKT